MHASSFEGMVRMLRPASPGRRRGRRILPAFFAGVSLAVGACGSTVSPAPITPPPASPASAAASVVAATASPAGVTASAGSTVGPIPSQASSATSGPFLGVGSALPVALGGYTVRLFATGTGDFQHPDSIVVAPGHVYVDYQNSTAKDGTDGKSSTIIDYNAAGVPAGAGISIVGHSDGLRLDPATGMLWATVNEDGNPALYTIEPATGAVAKYSLKAPHGGGYDDIAFLGGRAYLAASNPTLNSAGINTFPAIVDVTLNADRTTTLRPVLMGNAKATDLVAKAAASLDEVDPDSMTVDLAGELVLVDQGGSEIVTIAHPGTTQQQVSRIPVGTQLDDTVWAADASGSLFVTDGGTHNATYVVSGKPSVGTVFTESPNDSGVSSFLATVDLATGIVTPFAVGFQKPTGLVWSPGP